VNKEKKKRKKNKMAWLGLRREDVIRAANPHS